MTHSRRTFLRNGAFWLPAAALAPGMIVRAAFGGTGGSVKNLVLVELAGGNDGLNMVVPFGVDGGAYYSEFRPTIGIPEGSLLKLDASIGFNPTMSALKAKYDLGKLAIVHGVGYPNMNFSHEVASLIWAKGDPSLISSTGWVGRILNQFGAPAFPAALDVAEVPNTAFLGANEYVPGVPWLGAFDFPVDYDHWEDAQNLRDAYETAVNAQTGAGGAVGSMCGTAKGLLQLIDTFEALPDYDFVGAYPDDWFGEELQLVVRLMNANLGLRIFHVAYGGFDTHSEQDVGSYHSGRLGVLSDGLAALWADLANQGKLADTVIVVYSEFGRTCYENGSGGTDHGTINPVLVLGGSVVGGVKNAHAPMDPDNLDGDNELPRQADFRDVFAELGNKMYGVPAATLFPGFAHSSFGLLP